jgi:RNA polymerase sigma-70 factor, ECF subfamily
MAMSRSTEKFRAELKSLIPRLRRFGHAITGSRDAGDDLLQDALEKALGREAQFEPGTRLDSWMFRIMQTTWIDQTRASRRRQRLSEPMDEHMQVAGIDGVRDFAVKVELAQVRAAMGRLHEDERTVLALVSIEDMTYREAAETLGIPIGTVMSRVARARVNLLKLLGGPSESPDLDPLSVRRS